LRPHFGRSLVSTSQDRTFHPGQEVIDDIDDGSFEHRGTVYLIEAKWTDTRTDAAELRSFWEKAGDGLKGTRALFVQFSSFTD
jgi:hypothetical protein